MNVVVVLGERIEDYTSTKEYIYISNCVRKVFFLNTRSELHFSGFTQFQFAIVVIYFFQEKGNMFLSNPCKTTLLCTCFCNLINVFFFPA